MTRSQLGYLIAGFLMGAAVALWTAAFAGLPHSWGTVGSLLSVGGVLAMVVTKSNGQKRGQDIPK